MTGRLVTETQQHLCFLLWQPAGAEKVIDPMCKTDLSFIGPTPDKNIHGLVAFSVVAIMAGKDVIFQR